MAREARKAGTTFDGTYKSFLFGDDFIGDALWKRATRLEVRNSDEMHGTCNGHTMPEILATHTHESRLVGSTSEFVTGWLT